MTRLKTWQMILTASGAILLIAVIAVGLGSTKFRNDFNAIAEEVLSINAPDKKVVTEADLEGLPESVQRYLRFTGVIGKEYINSVRLKQSGVLRQTPEDSWKAIEAIEYFSVDPQRFVWMGQMAVGPLSIISARDSYVDEHGHMRILMLGIHTIGDVQGEEMDYSSLVRYLNEMMWFPTAYLNDNVSWEAVDNNSAKVTITEGNTSASAILHFDERGALTNFVGERYREVNGAFVKDAWETPITGYGEFDGLKLPVKGVAVWKLSSGDFSYFEMEITSLEYNVTSIYK